MKTPRFLVPVLAIASLLLTPFSARGVIETWDGGGADDNVSTNANWVDNTDPVSNLSFTDLVFGDAAATSKNVIFDAAFSAHSITIENVPSGFLGYTFSGQILSVGAGGIVNNDPMSSAFGNPVSFSGVANATINQAGSILQFNNTVTLPTNTLTVTGAGDTFFENFSGSSALTKAGAGIMNWTPTAPASLDIAVSAGTLLMRADGLTDVMGSGASIAVNGSSIFDMRDSLTLDGGDLTRESGADVILAAGKTLTVQDGGDVVMTGSYSNTTDSTITVTGAGSSFTGNSSLSFNGASELNVSAGGDVAATTAVNVGTSGDGSVYVSGSGSSLSGANLNVGSAGGTGIVAIGSSSTGMFATINVALSSTAGTSGTVIIQSGASVTGTALVIANVAGDANGAVTITGAGSTLTLLGTAITSIGAGVQNTGALNVNNGGTFHSGTGSATVRTTGSIVIDGGTYNSNGNLTLTGGQLERLSGAFTLAAGTTFTIQSDGDATFTGAYSNDTASSILVTGAGSTLSTAAATLSINGGSTLSALLVADVSTGGGAFGVGTGAGASGNGTVTLADAGSSLAAGALNVGQNGNAASLTFSGASTGTFTSINVDNSGVAGTSGLLQIEGGAVVTGTSLGVAGVSAANTGTVTITGAGSALTLSGAATANIGASGSSTGAFNVESSGTFNSGTGLTTVNATGAIAITSATFNANGDVTLNGGQLTRGAGGVFALDAGRTLTVQAGGDATFTGSYTNGTASSIVVTGAGSTLSTTSALTVGGGSITSVTAGGNVSSGATLSIGTSGGATVSVSGVGSALTAATTATIGAASGSAATVNVASGGTFTTGTGLTTVNVTGALNVNAGGTLTGASDFGGPGPINIAGTYLPGTAAGVNRTTSASFAQNMTLQGTTSITMELAGVIAGTDYDQLVFNGPGTPHVIWNGTLNINLILGFVPQGGEQFDLFDFDPARDAGAFTTINLPSLSTGLFWRASQLYNTGLIQVSFVPDTYAEWESAFGVTEGFDGDDDGDGIPNGIEFLLGTNPKAPFGPEGFPIVELSPINSVSDTTARVTFQIPVDPASDAYYRVSASPDLVNWTVIASKDGGGAAWEEFETAKVTEDAIVNGRIRITVSETLPLAETHRFHRLEGKAP